MTLSVLHVGLESLAVRVGGLNTYCTNLVEAQRANGINAVSTWVGGVEPYSEALSEGSLWRRNCEVARVVRNTKVDLIDVHFAPHALVAVASGALRHRPMVVHFQGPWAAESRWTGGSRLGSLVKRQIERFVLRRAESIVVLSYAFAEVVITNYGVRPERVRVVPPGVHLHTSTSQADARQRLALRPDTHLVVAVRRLVARMGLDVLIRAMVHVPTAELVILGEGPERSALATLIESLQLADRVHLMGLVSEAERNDWLSAASLTVVPTMAHEGFGLVVLESLAAGTPVVVSDVGGLVEVAEMSSFVASFAAGDVGELAEQILLGLHQQLADPETIRQSINGLSWPTVAAYFVQHYQELLTRVEEPRGVVVLDHTARLSGGELAMARTAEVLVSAGRFTPHFVLFENGPFERELRSRGITYEVLPLSERTQSRRRENIWGGFMISLWDSVTFALRLAHLLRQRGTLLVHTNSLKAFVLGTVASLGQSWRLVAHVRDLWSPPYLSAPTARGLRALLAIRTDAVIANSHVTAQAASPDARVIHSPVDSSFFAVPAPTMSPELRIGVVGRIAAWKGQDLMLEAASFLADVPFSITFVGGALFDEAGFETQLRKAAEPFGSQVRFLGSVADVPSVMATFDVTVLTSRSPEPFGNVVTEAMAAGRVVVVPRQGGVLDFIVDEDNGLFYEPNVASSLANVLRRVSSGEIDRNALGNRARATAARYGAPQIATLVESLYESVME
ncbi:MAG: glycosyltransferase family 4 protein [Actinobacteria bacterium]|nr:glycosyltransferase family 4 protein [Actinomycetota bacterium]